MTIQEALLAYLESLPGLVAVVGDRIYPNRRTPGETLPAITYFRVSVTTRRVLATWDCGTPRVHMQIDVWAETYEEASAVELLVCGTKADPRLNGYQGMMGSVYVQCAAVENRQDQYEPPARGEGGGVHRVILDVSLDFNE